ncbi:MAG: hypothetical protein JW944_05660 [Deltaproteobacteria bacterium]|nr:hypothetical protein [Deltaproteobacteria bacterium]
MSPILKIDKDDEEKEMDFEIDYQLSLDVEQRFRMMFQKSRELAMMLEKNGHRKPSEIIKRS